MQQGFAFWGQGGAQLDHLAGCGMLETELPRMQEHAVEALAATPTTPGAANPTKS